MNVRGSGAIRVSVVVPVYQNADSLQALFDRLEQVEKELMQLHGTSLQLIFVNDGSTDASQSILLSLKRRRADCTVVRLSRNFGAVPATRAGFGFVEGDAFICIAADLQDPPEILLDMVPRWLAGSKFVIAVRASRDDPWPTRLGAGLYYRLLRALVVPGYPIGGFDAAIMDRELLAPMRDASKNTFTSLLAYWLGYEPDVVEYHRARREHGRSGWTFTKKLKSFFDVMLGFSAMPIRLMSGIGAFVAIASFAYGAWIAIGAMLGQIAVSGFATLAVLLTFLVGLVLMMLGLIGEYVWRIYDEVNRRPDAVIDEVA